MSKNKQVKRFVGEFKKTQDAADYLTDAGFYCPYSKLAQIITDKRAASISLALQIEKATDGRYKAKAIVDDTVRFWREKNE